MGIRISMVILLASSLGVDGQFTLPLTAGSIGQVMVSNGSGSFYWANKYGGSNNVRSGDDSFIGGGYYNTSSGFAAFIGGGYYNQATAVGSSVVSGRSNQVSGNYSSISAGLSNQVSGAFAFIGAGQNNIASGHRSSILGGSRLTAESYGQTTIGLNNTPHPAGQNTVAHVATDRLFVVGNGTGNATRSDALVMLKNGNTTLNGYLTLANGAPGVAATSSFTLPNADGPATFVMQTDGAGTITWQDPTVISSDRRLKTNIEDLSNVLEKLSKLDGYRFNWNEIQNRNTEIDEIGLIAQEVQELYPELVSTDSDGFLRVKYISFVPLLLEAVKELEAQNKLLAATNKSLEAKQAADEQRFEKLESQLAQLMELLVPSNTSVGKE